MVYYRWFTTRLLTILFFLSEYRFFEGDRRARKARKNGESRDEEKRESDSDFRTVYGDRKNLPRLGPLLGP